MTNDPIVPGFRWAGVEAGLRKRPGRKDLALVVADEPVACAGLFTKSDMAAAPVQLSRPKAASGRARAVLMNAGCANACTGDDGLAAAERMAASLERIGVDASEVLVASTGVIGAPLAIDRLEASVANLTEALRPDGIRDFAHAITTTDTHEKVASRTGSISGRNVIVAGVCKGAGMIMPDMATMLACVATDAAVAPEALLPMLRAAAEVSFNAVTVDGDTSTNDTLYLLASGRATNPTITEPRGPAYEALLALVTEVCVDLARQIAMDGEGATKFVEMRVEEAFSAEEADAVARRIANSPLVKTAWHAADANWGRLMAAAGACGYALDPKRISISVDGADLVDQGVGLGAEAEAEAQAMMKKRSFSVVMRLGRGSYAKSIYTCDFSAEYVKINAEYRT